MLLTRIDADEVRHRAAMVRKEWTVAERRRRMGLPPDVPRKLRSFLHNWSVPQFSGGVRVLTM